MYVEHGAGAVHFRWVTAPTQRLSLTGGGNVRYQLKTPWRDGSPHVVFEPLDFLVPLAALVPKPPVDLARYPGVCDNSFQQER